MKKTFLKHLFSGFVNSFFTVCVPLFTTVWSLHCIFDKPISTGATIFGILFFIAVNGAYFTGMWRNYKDKPM